jgi:hypothetical protein
VDGIYDRGEVKGGEPNTRTDAQHYFLHVEVWRVASFVQKYDFKGVWRAVYGDEEAFPYWIEMLCRPAGSSTRKACPKDRLKQTRER